jgi:hypothetical protein
MSTSLGWNSSSLSVNLFPSRWEPPANSLTEKWNPFLLVRAKSANFRLTFAARLVSLLGLIRSAATIATFYSAIGLFLARVIPPPQCPCLY